MAVTIFIPLHGTAALVFLVIALVVVVCEVVQKFYRLVTHKPRNQNTQDYRVKTPKEP